MSYTFVMRKLVVEQRRRGIKTVDLALALGMPAHVLSKVRRGLRKGVAFDSTKAYANYLGVQVTFSEWMNQDDLPEEEGKKRSQGTVLPWPDLDLQDVMNLKMSKNYK